MMILALVEAIDEKMPSVGMRNGAKAVFVFGDDFLLQGISHLRHEAVSFDESVLGELKEKRFCAHCRF